MTSSYSTLPVRRSGDSAPSGCWCRRGRLAPVVADDCAQDCAEHRLIDFARVEQKGQDANHDDGEYVAEPDCPHDVLEGQSHGTPIAINRLKTY